MWGLPTQLNPFQVGGDPNNGIGVGISTSGNIRASGIITATTFSGAFSGNLTGNVVGDVTGTASTATLANTATLAVNSQGLTGNPSVSVTNVNASGVGTFPTLVTTDLNTVTLKGYNSLKLSMVQQLPLWLLLQLRYLDNIGIMVQVVLTDLF